MKNQAENHQIVKAAALSRIKFLHPVPREEYISLCEQEAIRAGEAGCDVFLLPEHFDSFGSLEAQHCGDPYEADTDWRITYQAFAEPLLGPLTKRFGAIAHRYSMYILVSFAELDGKTLYNTCAILGRDGTVCGKYRKTHLCGTEARLCGTQAGNEIPVFDLDFGRIGIAICMDIYFPEVFRVLQLKGADVIFWPHQTYGPSEEMLQTLLKARAIDTRAFFVASNFASPDYYAPYDPGHALTGRAMIVNRDGMIIADTGHYPGLAITELHLDMPCIGKDVCCIRRTGIDDLRVDMLHFRRPELYDEIIKPCDNQAVYEGRFLD